MDENKDNIEQFFYAFVEQELYDDTIELVVPEYSLLHKHVIVLLANSIPLSTSPVVLDIGAGTGTETIAILKNMPSVHVVAVDISKNMIDKLNQNIILSEESNGESLKDRCSTNVGDVLDPSFSEQKLTSLIPQSLGKEKYDAVISAFTIHHFSHEEKKETYCRIYNSLAKGGVFINLDLFSFTATPLKHLALSYDMAWISHQFRNPEERFAEAQKIPSQKRQELQKQWLKHYEEENVCEPIESKPGYEGQEEMLFDIGFSEVGVPLRLWQSGVLWAKR